MRPGHVRAEASTRLERPPDRKRLGLALHRNRLQRLVVEHPLRRAVGLLGDRDPVHRRRPLQSGGGVDDVAEHASLALFRTRTEGHDRLACVDPDSHLQRERRGLLVQLVDRLQDAKARPNGALGVVLVRDGRSERGHHRVADELLHGAAVALDLLAQACVIREHARANVLGIRRVRGCSEADEIAEENGHDLALFLDRGRRSIDQRRSAERAKRKLVR